MGVESFAELLRRHRLAAGLTQEGLAERSGLSVRGISDLERGATRRPHLETVRMLAAALALPPESLAAFRAAASADSRDAAIAPATIPEPLTTLIDREGDLAFIGEKMRPDSGTRLLTLLGPGGVGKTRLAIRVAGEVRAAFADGVAFVPLAGLSDPHAVPGAIAAALGIRDLSDRASIEVLTRQLQDRQLLVVVDNFEHLLGAASDIATLLSRCAGLTFLATSRAPLRISGERVYHVRPLELPKTATATPAHDVMLAPSVQLFVKQAQAVKPQFDLTEANAASVAAICTRVDGLPLALELAAARMRLLAPQELESLLDNRLGILTGGPQDHPARHQTVRATIGWSHDFLTTEEQVAFRRFAVFPVGATLESAVAVLVPGNTMQALDLLTALLDQSLLQRFESASGNARFVMLETIREFALERLAASEDDVPARVLHAAHFLDLAEAGEIGLTGPDQAAWMARLESEYGNLRAALGWAVERGYAVSSQRFGSALWRFWANSGRLREGREWLDRALALDPEARTATRAEALLRRGNIAVDLADYPTARAMYEASLEIYRSLSDDVNANRALSGVGLVQFSQGEYAAARAANKAVLVDWQAQGSRHGQARALVTLGRIAAAVGETGDARRLLDASLAIRRELGDSSGIAYSEFYLGSLYRMEGKIDAARNWLTRSLAGFREVDDRLGVASVLNELGSLARDEGNDRVALTYYADAIREGEEAGAVQEVVEGIEGIATVVIAQGQMKSGITLLAAASSWRSAHGAPLPPAFQGPLQHALERARNELPPHTFEGAWSEGERATLDEAIDLANTLYP